MKKEARFCDKHPDVMATLVVWSPAHGGERDLCVPCAQAHHLIALFQRGHQPAKAVTNGHASGNGHAKVKQPAKVKPPRTDTVAKVLAVLVEGPKRREELLAGSGLAETTLYRVLTGLKAEGRLRLDNSQGKRRTVYALMSSVRKPTIRVQPIYKRERREA